jgi:hypothetical protein
MKISPVAGTPTINQPPTTGLNPERAARAKAIASGQAPVAPTEEDKAKLLDATQKIVMQTNKTPGGTEISDKDGLVDAVVEPEITTPDTIVQAKEDSEATQPLSPQLAALARQRRALQVKEKELLDKEKALGGQSNADFIAKLKSSPLSVLLEHGVTYDQLTQDILGQQSNINPEVEKLKAELAELKTGVDKRFSEGQIAQETSAINYVADKLDALVATGDDFDLLKAADGEEEVIRRVYSHWKKTGKELDIATVAKEYQEELAEEAVRYAKIKQVQSRLLPTEPVPVTPPQQQGIRTLTNKDSARPTMDRKQRAILAMQGQLKR